MNQSLFVIPTRFFEGLPEESLEHFERDYEVAVEAEEAVAFGKALLDQLRGGR